MPKQIGTKAIIIDGVEVECKVYSAGGNSKTTFNNKMKCKGKDMPAQRNARKVEIHTKG